MDFVPLGALSSPRLADPNAALFRIQIKHGILNISIDVCKKWSLTPMELLTNSENPCVFFYDFEIVISKILIFH